MTQRTAGFNFIWYLAAVEGIAAQSEFVENEHVFAALTGGAIIMEIGDNAAFVDRFGPAARAEITALADFLVAAHIDRERLVQKLRSFIGKGGFEHSDASQIHRSDQCKATFDRAMLLAREQSQAAVNCFHLMSALLENPGPRIAQATVLAGGDVQALHRAITEAAAKQNTPAAPEAVRPRPVSFFQVFGTDLTQLAKDGKIQPLIGRKKELLQIARTLSRKTKSNPLLLGDPGVGKTALVRGLAWHIANGNTVPGLKDKKIIEIDTGKLLSGTANRGDLEQRISLLIEETAKDPRIIVFIDEIHSLLGGGRGKVPADLLKPALVRDDFRLIVSTTDSEYRTYIEPDAAISRRFQPINVDEPSQEETIEILMGLRLRFEQHHDVRIERSAIERAVELSSRYLPDRRLPDKAFDLIDEACARAKVITISTRRPQNAQFEFVVTGNTVAEVVAEWTRIKVADLTSDDRLKLAGMRDVLTERVIGQPGAIDRVCEVVARSRAGLKSPNGPMGVFLFLGPTGVGKTELAKALAAFLFGSEDDLLRFDMSEYMERHAVAKLIGSPPGYVGYDEEGQLTGRLRRNPYSIVLLDEFEKAHPDTSNLFLQLFDEGRLTDSHGRLADGRNAIFIMTSNIGAGIVAQRPIGFAAHPKEEIHTAQEDVVMEEVKRAFRPEFLNRIDEIIQFRPLSETAIAGIARIRLDEVARRLLDHDVVIEFSDSAVELIAHKGYDPAYGARHLARTVDRLVSRPLSQQIIQGALGAGVTLRAEAEGDSLVFRKLPRAEAAI